MTFTQLIAQNIKPIMLIGVCTVIGFLCGHLAIGFCVGVLIVGLATLLF